MASRYAFALLSLTGVAVRAAAVARDETSPLQIPRIQADPSRYIDPDFPALAFEQASFVDYALSPDGSPNAFSQNLVDAIFARTGGKPVIRLGGTRADYASYVPEQRPPVAGAAADLGKMTIGPSYWDVAAESFPRAQYIIQVPMADPDMSHAERWATTATARIGLDRIHSFEPGNEPDLYPAKGLGPPAWQGKQENGTYVSNFLNYCDRIAAAIGLPRGTRKFQALDTSSHPADPQQDVFVLSLRSVLQQGLDNHHSAKTIARHYYQSEEAGGKADAVAKGLMNHGAIAARLDVYRDDLEFLASSSTKIPYALSEVGSAMRGGSSVKQATLGTALWQVDLQLYGLSLGIARFHLQQAAGGASNLWLPGGRRVSDSDSDSDAESSNATAAQVLPGYYAQPFVADFVGPAGTVQVKNVPLEPDVSAYVAYEGVTARRAAIVNLKYWSKCHSDGGTRYAQYVRLSPPAWVVKVRVVHLTSPDGATAKAKSITYAGSQWTYESNGNEVKGVRNDGDVLSVVGGTVDIPVKMSEAVIVHFM